MLQKCLDNQRPVVKKLNGKVMLALQRSGYQTRSPLSSKLDEMNGVYGQVERLAQQRHNELIDKLQQVSHCRPGTARSTAMSVSVCLSVCLFA